MSEKIDLYIKKKLREVEEKPITESSLSKKDTWSGIRSGMKNRKKRTRWIKALVLFNSVFIAYLLFMQIDHTPFGSQIKIHKQNKGEGTNKAANIKNSYTAFLRTKKPYKPKKYTVMANRKSKTEPVQQEEWSAEPRKNFWYASNDTLIKYRKTYITTDTLIIDNTNLIPNPSFEAHFSEKFSYYSKSWKKCLKSDSPDYFYDDNENPINMTFDEHIGGIHPRTGKAFVGIYCYRKNPSQAISQVREYIQARLVEPLVKDSTYLFKMFVCLDAESTMGIKTLGALFRSSILELKQEKEIYKYKPQIILNKRYLTETNQWMELSAKYKARGNEKYIIIGNFKPDEKIKSKPNTYVLEENKKRKWNLLGEEEVAYYYVDDISLNVVLTQSLRKEKMIAEKTEINTPPTLSKDSIYVLKNVLFEFDKSNLLPVSVYELDKLYKILKNHPEYNIMLMGHTDNYGSEQYNLDLSNRRANEVKRYLVHSGIDSSKITSIGYGKSRPLNQNQTEEARQQNRRVEFKLITK